MTRRIALISEHASPLAVLGGVDGGGQNVYVGELAKSLAALGFEIDIFTRRDSEVVPEAAEWTNAVRIVYVTAGPPRPLPKEELLPFIGEFTRRARIDSPTSASRSRTESCARRITSSRSAPRKKRTSSASTMPTRPGSRSSRRVSIRPSSGRSERRLRARAVQPPLGST